MGRPLNKKYFGNTNTPQIGGEGVASVTLDALGSYTTRPTVTFSAPENPTGVTATGTVVSEILSVVISGTMTGYEAQDEIYFGDAVITVDIGGVDGGSITAATVTTRGSFTTLASGAQATTTNGDGEGALITVTYRAKSVTITNAGSGYVSALDAAPTFTQSVTGTSVLTSVKFNAITITGRVVAGSTVALDIVRQVGSRRYSVTDGTNTGVVQLTSDAVDAAGEAQIVATDSDAGTYYVTKLTARRAVVTRGTGTQFATGASVPWVLDTAVENVSIKVPNA
jgi:hypothetical protein